MRPDRVVLIAPLLDDDGGFLQAVEDFSVEAFVAQLAAPASDMGVGPATQLNCPTLDLVKEFLQTLVTGEFRGRVAMALRPTRRIAIASPCDDDATLHSGATHNQ